MMNKSKVDLTSQKQSSPEITQQWGFTFLPKNAGFNKGEI